MSSMKAAVPKYLHTERLVLELFDHSPEHYECLLGSINSPTAYARLGNIGIKTPEKFDEMIKTTRLAGVYCQSFISDLDFYYILRISGKDGPLIGGISLQQRNKSVPPDIGWCLLESYMGKGYATEGAKEFLRYLREDFGLQEVMAWPGLTNRESCRVAQKIGLVEGGLVRSKETGENNMVYILPGMNFDSNVSISMWGDEGSTGQV